MPPLALGLAGISLLGAGLQALGQIQKGAAAKKNADYNAAMYEQQAQLQVETGVEAVRRIGVQQNLMEGVQRSGYAASGVRVDEGSPLMVIANTAREYKLEQLQTGFAADTSARFSRENAIIQRYLGDQGLKQAELASVGTLLSGAGQAGTAGLGYAGIRGAGGLY